MKILNWMQKKLQGSKKSETAPIVTHFAVQETKREESSNWHHGLLMIGTLGNNEMKDDYDNTDFHENLHSLQELSEFTLEEVGKLQKELTKLLKLKPVSIAGIDPELHIEPSEDKDFPLDRFLNCPSSLEINRRFCADSEEKKEEFSNNSGVVLSRGKEVNPDSTSLIRQKSISFLLKKMLVCRSGFGPVPSLKDLPPEPRMEKFLRTILRRKIYSQSSPPTSSKKYLEKSKSTAKMESEDQSEDDKENHGYKWVKTDSDYIVLEM